MPNAEVPVSQEALPEQMVVVREPTQSQGMLVSSSSVQQVPPKSAQNMSYGDVRELPTMQYDQQQQHTAGPKSPSRVSALLSFKHAVHQSVCLLPTTCDMFSLLILSE